MARGSVGPLEQAVWLLTPSRPKGTLQARGSAGVVIPDDNNDAIEDVVGVLDVAKGTVHEQLQQHLQGKEAGEDDVADFQGVGELLGLQGRAGMKQLWLVPEPLTPVPSNTGPQGEEAQEWKAGGGGQGGSGCSGLWGTPSPKESVRKCTEGQPSHETLGPTPTISSSGSQMLGPPCGLCPPPGGSSETHWSCAARSAQRAQASGALMPGCATR